MPKFHLSQPRDGSPVTCDCNIKHDHDAESLTYAQACLEVEQLIVKFQQDIDLYDPRFATLCMQVQSIITRTAV